MRRERASGEVRGVGEGAPLGLGLRYITTRSASVGLLSTNEPCRRLQLSSRHSTARGMGREGDAFRYAGHPADDVWCVNYGGREKGREGGGGGRGEIQ